MEQHRSAMTEAYERWQHARTLIVDVSYEVTAYWPRSFDDLVAAQRAEAIARSDFDRLFAQWMSESLTGVTK